MNKAEPVQILARLLSESGAHADVTPARFARSTIYDLEYRTTITACVFEMTALSRSDGARQIKAAKLKLLQFVAIRPWLLPILREWSSTRHDPQASLYMSQRLRRGFLSDGMHDATVDYLVAHRLLARDESHLISGHKSRALTALHSATVSANLVAAERLAIAQARTLVITNEMLEGW